mmetsp:Transcript_4704/g.14195  ORF Transcript_4704/g.14195 Transcript_4704/m.14195 type:complete len:389 (-) Transcript_4704:107-1273(-)
MAGPTFDPKYEWATKNNILSGITLGQWLRLLWWRGRHVDWLRYWQRVAFITLLATINSVISVMEWMLWESTIQATAINPRPVFVLGHPRTGTTLLHTLLSLDKDRFAYCSTFQCGFPSGFLCLRNVSWLFAGVVDKTRPMDNMDLNFETPQEDELATNLLSSGVSPYMPLVMMRQEPDFRPFFTFKDGGFVAGRPAVERWTEAFLYFLKKVSVFSQGRRLVIKSPVHTARVALILQLFPDAQFVYIHRDPVTVLQSALNMADKTYWYSYLNRPSPDQILDFVTNQFEALFDAYEADKKLIPDGNLVEVRFADLEADLAGEMGRIYRELGWNGYDESARPAVAAYAAAKQSYRKNKLAELDPELSRLITERWAHICVAQGYPLPPLPFD